MPDQFGLISDSSCDYASPFVIVNKNRMAVDYREVNMQLEATANQLPYQPTFFQILSRQPFYAKMDNIWGYHQLRLTEDSSIVTAIINPWGVIDFGVPFRYVYSTW